MKHVYIFVCIFLCSSHISFAKDLGEKYSKLDSNEKNCVEQFILAQIKNRRKECKRMDETASLDASTNCYHRAGLIFETDKLKGINACSIQK